MKLVRRNLTYANVIATIALVLALGGATAFAASKINGSNIKAKSIAGGKLKNDTVTGKQVKESSLGQVPNAAKADTATSAGNASTVGGLSPATLRLPPAYGHFTTNGGVATLDPTRTSSSVVSILRTPVGNYCVNLDFVPVTVSATVDSFQGGKHIIHAEINPGEANCEVGLKMIQPEGANGEGVDGHAFFQAW